MLRAISEMEGLEGWVQSKLTLASEYLESVRDYLKYEAASQESEMMPFAEAAADYALEQMLSEMHDSGLERSKKLKERIQHLERKIREQSTPVVGGMSQSTAPGGDITTRSDIGGTSVSQTKTPGGFVKQSTASMDMGPAGSVSQVKAAPQQPGQLAGTTTVTRTDASGTAGSAVQGVGFAGAGKGVTAATPKVVTTGDTAMAQQAQNIMKPGMSEQRKSKMRESATGGASSAGAVATSMSGPGRKPTSGVPKRLGNAHKTKQVAVGKGIYDK
jgi:hypothetical protein